VNKINYQVDLIEVKRWVEGKHDFLLVHELEEDPSTIRTRRPVSGLRTYDADFYATERNKKSVEAFLRYADELQALAKKNQWQLDRKFNRNYCGFKAGFFNAFGIDWWGSRTFGLFVKISQAESKRMRPQPQSYSTRWKQAHYPIEIGKTKLSQFVPILDLAYRKVATGDED
jgi:hypothetical protein